MSRGKGEPDYDFGPYEDEYRGFEIRDDDTGRGPLILLLALGVLLIFTGVVWTTYRQGVRPSEGGLPVIAANDAPYKRSPDERGGVEVAGQDKAYYDSKDGLGDPAMQQTAARNPLDIRRRDLDHDGNRRCRRGVHACSACDVPLCSEWCVSGAIVGAAFTRCRAVGMGRLPTDRARSVHGGESGHPACRSRGKGRVLPLARRVFPGS